MIEHQKPQTPAEREAAKTGEQRAEDIAYTLNHSLYCTITDFINPPVNTMVEEYLPGIFSKITRFFFRGCGHDHSKDHAHGPECDHEHGHAHHEDHPATGRWEKIKASMQKAFSKERFWSWCKGEFIGDFGAVPLTIGMQRWFPGVMHGVRKAIEPVMGPIFRWGIERSSKRWAAENQIKIGSKEYTEHVNAVYEHEMSHAPQAAVWTGFAIPLNVIYQMLARGADKKIGFWPTVLNRTASCIVSLAITAGAVISARTLAPHAMRQLDKKMTDSVITPLTKIAGKAFGIQEKDVDRMIEKEKQLENGSWTERSKPSENILQR